MVGVHNVLASVLVPMSLLIGTATAALGATTLVAAASAALTTPAPELVARGDPRDFWKNVPWGPFKKGFGKAISSMEKATGAPKWFGMGYLSRPPMLTEGFVTNIPDEAFPYALTFKVPDILNGRPHMPRNAAAAAVEARATDVPASEDVQALAAGPTRTVFPSPERTGVYEEWERPKVDDAYWNQMSDAVSSLRASILAEYPSAFDYDDSVPLQTAVATTLATSVRPVAYRTY